MYSTALLEGLAFGLTTYVVTLPGSEQLQAITDAGLAQRVADASALWRALREQPAAAAHDCARLWSPGAVAAFRDFLHAQIADPMRKG